MEVVNTTTLANTAITLPDGKNWSLLVVIKGTWQLRHDGALALAEEQQPVLLSPVYYGAPNSSSIRYDSDLLLEKPGTDCILNGHAWAPKVGVAAVDVLFAVGPVRKKIRVFGERFWMKALWKVALSRPLPFERIPLVWERAFGGVDASWPDPACHEHFVENPIGRGLRAKKSKLPVDGLRLPNLEDPSFLITKLSDRPDPAGVGVIPPHWQPRARFADKYHEVWRESRFPLLPEGQDLRFNACAAPGLTTPNFLTGTEPVVVENAAKQGRLSFRLPGVKPEVTVRLANSEEELPIELDTVIVEPDEERVVLVWRGRRVVHHPGQEIRQVTIRMQNL
ncbi:DUF2169 family type VI secretion system accessory protein [Geomesophilobacter sediminis]|uniref:DUF2169 domain-containing protein n=1 Tax=Geomesophilobacter sediminis TaxID=2798584 RepID=A0A8J7IPV5_9BACT|nr:DUF2169 domain-containing protein [Geomesophilobacter sediminis]MBJ6724519.1 DUF2169 domain-containing protein [Geomesophilobacter sediminis]